MQDIIEKRLKKSNVIKTIMEAKQALKNMKRPDTPELPRYSVIQTSILWK